MNYIIFLFIIIIIIFYTIFYFNKCLINSYSLFINKQYFKIFFRFICFVFIILIISDFWWYSSEYYFIDIHENVYNEFYGSNKKLTDKFIKGNANIFEKIKAKFLLKRNIYFLVQFGIIIVLKILNLFIYKPKKYKKYKKYNIPDNESLLSIDYYIAIKYYQIYRLLYYKMKYLLLFNNRDNEYYNFINFKYKEFRNLILPNLSNTDNQFYHNAILRMKNELINVKNLNFINPDYTYSPFLLDDYCIASISKLVLSPNYS